MKRYHVIPIVVIIEDEHPDFIGDELELTEAQAKMAFTRQGAPPWGLNPVAVRVLDASAVEP